MVAMIGKLVWEAYQIGLNSSASLQPESFMQRLSIRGSMSLALGVAMLALTATAASAAPSVLPGDRGRPMDGFMPARPPQAAQATSAQRVPARAPEPPTEVAAPPLALALKAVSAIAEGCRQYPLGIAVIDSMGTPKLIYVPDGSEGWHGYSAVRKAWTAMVFNMPTVELAEKVRDNPELQARIKADPNLQAFAGARPWKVGEKIVGAIGVSGAEPGGHDDECVQLGFNKIRDEMK
jgi:uncharacterized protein GlcG (DUF336 family)